MPIQIPIWAYPAAGAAAVLVLIGWMVVRFQIYQSRRSAEGVITSVAYEMLRDVLVPNGNGGQIHVHHLLLTQRGLLVIDLMDVQGAIFGGDQMLEWTVIGKKQRYTFGNPQHGLYDRIAAVKLLTGDVPVEGRVLFTTRGEFPKGKPRLVMRIDELTKEFPVVDKARRNITAAFGDVWANVKKNAERSPLPA